MNPGLLLLLLAAGVVNGQKDGVVTTHTFQSVAEARTYTLNIYYPPGYSCSNLKYPIIYLLHGHSGDHTDWIIPAKGDIVPTANALMYSGQIQPAIIVVPGDQFSWWIDSPYYRQAQTAFLNEVMPYVEQTLLPTRVIAQRRARMIGGLSAGGYGTIRLCWLRPDLWVAAAPLSPAIYQPDPPATSSAITAAISPFKTGGNFNATFWRQMNYPSFINSYIAAGWDNIIPMYLNSGDFDRFRIAYHVAWYFNQLWDLQANITSKVQLRIVSGDHDWPVWRSTIGDAMTFMLSYSSPAEVNPALTQTQGLGPGCIAPPAASSSSSSSSSTGQGGASSLAPISLLLFASAVGITAIVKIMS
jgi:enterochelin esterase-like enzyme